MDMLVSRSRRAIAIVLALILLQNSVLLVVECKVSGAGGENGPDCDSTLSKVRDQLAAAESKVKSLEKEVADMRKQIVEMEMQSCQAGDNIDSNDVGGRSQGNPNAGYEKKDARSLEPADIAGPKYSIVRLEIGGEQREYKVYLVTYTTDLAKQAFCILSASAVSRGYHLNVLGSKRQKEFDKDMFLDKTWAFADFLNKLPKDPQSIIVFVDAFDVLFTAGPKVLVRNFVATGKQILFSGERGCAVQREALSRADSSCDQNWPAPGTATTVPYLNSGAFMAFVPAAQELLALARQEHDEYVAYTEQNGLRNPYFMGGDQALYGHLFAHGRKKGQLVRDKLNYGIDYHNKVFLCMYLVELDRGLQFTKEGRAMATPMGACPENMFNAECVAAFRARNVTYPAVLHFNGHKEKGLLLPVAKRMRWNPKVSQEEVWQSNLWDEDRGEDVSLGSSCAQHASSLACESSVGECLNKQR